MGRIDILMAATFGFLASTCGQSTKELDVNRPIAYTSIPGHNEDKQTEAAILSFAEKHRFAVQRVIINPQGMEQFNTQLYRDDIRLTVNKMRDGELELFAYPLCVCEVERRLDLKGAARAEIDALQKEIVSANSR